MHRTAPTSTPGLSPNPTRARPEHRASPQLTPQSHSASPVTPLRRSLHCSRPPSSPSQLRTLSRVAPRAPCPRSAAASRQQLLSTSASLQYISHPSTVHGQCVRSAYAMHKRSAHLLNPQRNHTSLAFQNSQVPTPDVLPLALSSAVMVPFKPDSSLYTDISPTRTAYR